MEIEQPLNTALKKVYFNIHYSINGNDSGIGSYDRLDVTCHKCGKQGHIKRDCSYKGNCSNGNSHHKSKNEIQ